MIIPEYVLIIANSGRMLAQAAKNVGLKPLVIDIFADIDTRQYAYAFQQVTSLSEQDLIPVIDHFIGKEIGYGARRLERAGRLMKGKTDAVSARRLRLISVVMAAI